MPPRKGPAERCRYCGRPLDPADPVHAEHWPFCAARCKLAELGAWFEGRYVISRPIDQVADDAAPPGPPDAGNGHEGGPE